MSQDKEKFTNRNLQLSAYILAMLFAILCIVVATQCGQPGERVVETSPGPGGTCQDGRAVGETWKVACEAPLVGEKVWVCEEKGKPSKVIVDCKPTIEECVKTTFEAHIKPIVSAKCVSCHTSAGFEDYSVASNYASEWVRRINLNSGDIKRMPQPPRDELLPQEKAKFDEWLKNGKPKDVSDCDRIVTPEGKEGIQPIEDSFIIDSVSLNKDDRLFVRYVKATVYRGDAMKKALDKLLNSLNRKDSFVTSSSFLAGSTDRMRFDLRSYGLDRTDWLRIEAAEPLNFVSKTAQGATLRLLSATRKPWLHLENLIDTVSSNPKLYYELLDIPEDFDDLTEQLGVNFEDDLRGGEASLVGFTGSVIAKQKNRLMSRHESTDGYFWVSHDSVDPDGVEERNLFKFPLLKETGSRAVFDFAAQEILFSLPNGFMGTALYDNKGRLQLEAPLEVVSNLETVVKPAPVVAPSSSCQFCHAKGILPAQDQVRAFVTGSSSGLNDADVERVKQLYKQQNSLNALFRVDNAQYQAALAKIGIDPSEKDPIHQVRETYRLSYNLAKASTLFFTTPEKLRACIAQNDTLDGIGQLVTGALVTFEQLTDATILRTILDACRILEERDNGQ